MQIYVIYKQPARIVPAVLWDQSPNSITVLFDGEDKATILTNLDDFEVFENILDARTAFFSFSKKELYHLNHKAENNLLKYKITLNGLIEEFKGQDVHAYLSVLLDQVKQIKQLKAQLTRIEKQLAKAVKAESSQM